MKKLNLLFLVLLFLCISPAAQAGNAPAEKKSAQPVQKSAAAPPEKKSPGSGFGVMLLMDSSGSMRKTDPHDYRKAAAKLFLSLMGEGDSAGVVSFGDSAKVLSPLVQNSKGNQKQLFGAVDRISSKEFSTNIQEGVKKGYDELKPSNKERRILVLMSDGKLTLGSKEKEAAAYAELSKLLPELSKSGIRLYSVAFSELSDARLLEEMAKATGGFFRYAKEDKDIHVMFTSIFEKVKSPDTVPLEGDTFGIDKDIKEVILVISKKPGTSTTLSDPANRKYTFTKHDSNVQWFGSKVFDVITVKDPAVGKWKVALSTTEGNKVFVITNLSLKSSFDKGFVNKGDTVLIDAWLEKDGGMLKEKDVLDQVSFSAAVTGPDGKTSAVQLADSGKNGDQSAGDGRYSGAFAVAKAGEYTVKIAAEGKTFKREKSLQFKAVEPPAGTKAPPRVPASKKVSWKEILIKFGIVNLALFAVLMIVFSARKISLKKKTKVKKRK